ncbi:MAG TPA: hypothetical protein VGM93_14425, partial [Acidimicrobiales bacterium]
MSGGALAATLLAACSGGDSGTKHGSTSGGSTSATGPGAAGAHAATADGALAPPGTPGLMAEAAYQRRVDEYLALATAQPNTTSLTGV